MESVGSTHQINDYTYSAEFKVASYRATGSDGAVAPPGLCGKFGVDIFFTV